MTRRDEKDSLSLPFNRGSLTSELAAKSKALDVGPDEERVLAALRKAGDSGLTDDELEEKLQMTHQSASARRNGLMRKGLVCDGGKLRLTRSRRKAVVWVVGRGEDVIASSGPSPKRLPRRPCKRVLLAATREALASHPSEDLLAVIAWLQAVAR